MNKIAILVIGAKAPLILSRVLDFFVDSRFRFFLHVDAKIHLSSYLKELGHADQITLIEPRFSVFWGGFTMIEAELALIRAALQDDEINSLVLWSDDTAPLRSPSQIYASLSDAPDRMASEVRDYTQEWYTKFYFGDSNFTSYVKHLEPRNFGAADWENIQRLQRFTERGKKKLEKVYFSRQWWALSRHAATTMLNRLDEDEHLKESFRYSLFPDEILFATLFHLCFPDVKVPDVPMFADYERPPVPYVYTKPQELPDLSRVPDHCLFLRKIWPWSVALVDRLVQNWPPAEPQLLDEETYETALAAAVDARDDGELDLSAELFASLWKSHSHIPEVALGYVKTLRKLKQLKLVDQILSVAIKRHPEHFELRRVWAEVPSGDLDHEEVIRRGEILYSAFPPANYPAGWQSMAMIFGSYSETLRWGEIQTKIKNYENDLAKHPTALRITLWQTTELCLTGQIKTILDKAQPEAWRQLPPEANGNLRLRVNIANLNKRLVVASGVQVVSIGQNCLPYLLGGRWGLITGRERPEAITPFDRGAFHKDNAALVIENDFDTFSDHSAFVKGGVYDGSTLYKHSATGVYFYHERGPFWLKNDGERFWPHLERMLNNWRRVSTTGRRLFVFCLCGEGDLKKLVEAMSRQVLGVNAHLIIVDVLQQPHPCPEHEHVTYVHVPYPKDYTWDEFTHQTAARGTGFELSVIIPIMDRLISALSDKDADAFVKERREILQKAARSTVSWKRNHDNSVALYATLRQVDPSNVSNAIGYAHALRDSGRMEQAQEVLEQEVARHPRNYDIHAAWADIGVVPFDWPKKLRRLRALRQAFPPENHPRSWSTFSQELKTLLSHGFLDEGMDLINERRDVFTSRRELFQDALSASIRYGHLLVARELLNTVAPDALAELPSGAAELILKRLNEADINRELVIKSQVQVIPLGQNAMPTMLSDRWGLKAEPRRLSNSTPFELGEFLGQAAADVIADDFASISDPASYTETLAWGGGRTLRHTATGVAFAPYKSARIDLEDKERFFKDLDMMLTQWNCVKNADKRIFLFVRVDRADLTRLVEVVAEQLLGQNAHLVIVDLSADAALPTGSERIIVLRCPAPKDYNWTNTLGSATAAGLHYERMLLEPILKIVKSY